MSLAAKSPSVGFELDTDYQLQEGSIACAYSARFQSVVGTGRVFPVEDEAEKRAGLTAIMAQLTGRADWVYDPAVVQTVAVLRLEVETLSCKAHP